MVDVGGREEVVRHIGVDVGVVVAPVHGGGDAVDAADELLSEAQLRVGVALHAAGAARPGPAGVPRDAGAGHPVDVGALRAGAAALAPEVVVHRVGAAGVARVLTA